MNKKIGLIAAGAIVVAGTTFAAASPASAAQGTRPCPSGDYCFYNNADYGTNPSVIDSNEANWHLNYKDTTSGSFNNPPGSTGGDRRSQVSSVINNGNRTICLWDQKKGWPDKLILRVLPYEDLKFVGDSANDKADKWKVYSGRTGC
jgi:Peptidase inhibitor family I36